MKTDYNFIAISIYLVLIISLLGLNIYITSNIDQHLVEIKHYQEIIVDPEMFQITNSI